MKTLTDDVMELAGQVATDDKVEAVKVAVTMMESSLILQSSYSKYGFKTKEDAEKYATELRETGKYFVLVMMDSDREYKVDFIKKGIMKNFLEMKDFLEGLA